jgi:hypothetical protein
MQEEEEFYYDVVCNACLRHFYKPPKHQIVRFGSFLRLCSDECLHWVRSMWLIPCEKLKKMIVNKIINNPELYDVSCLPDDVKEDIRWARSCKDEFYRWRRKGRCGCVAYDCYNWSKKCV